MTGAIVEMVGNLGAGKTAIVRHLNPERLKVAAPSPLLDTASNAGQMPARQGLAIVADALFATLTSPSLGLALTRYFAASGPNGWRLRQMLIVASWMVRLPRVRQKSEKILVMEEGIIHRLANFALPGSPVGDPSTVVRKALPGRIDALVHVKCDEVVAFNRMRVRESTMAKMERWPDEFAWPAHKLIGCLILQSVRAAQDSGIPVLIVDSTNISPEENAKIIENWCASLVRQ